VVVLGPMIGYDKAAAIAPKANDEGLTLKKAALQSSDIDEERFDEVVDPRTMVGHGVGGS
jgi:fumarate hydratase, class II